MTGLLSRLERFAVVGSTNDVVRDWLAAGVPEVCLAVADVQQAGRGRGGRAWVAPTGTGLLLSVGTRPTWIEPDCAWRVAAAVSLAIAEAAEAVAGLPAGAVRLKWPNDLVVVAAGGDRTRGPGGRDGGASRGTGLRKLGGILAESSGLGGDAPGLVVGLGLNVDWEPADFPAELAPSMTSLRELAGRPVAREGLLAAFVERLEDRLGALREGRFAVDDWAVRQALPGATVRLEGTGEADGEWPVLAVDGQSGALVVGDPAAPGGARRVRAGEAVHVRLAGDRVADRAALALPGQV